MDAPICFKNLLLNNTNSKWSPWNSLFPKTTLFEKLIVLSTLSSSETKWLISTAKITADHLLTLFVYSKSSCLVTSSGLRASVNLLKKSKSNVAYRWFLRISLSEKVIHASTLSQNRIRRFNGTDIFERIFGNIVIQAMEKGLVEGRELFTDSTHLKANANKNKRCNEERQVRASAYLDMLN